MSVDYHSGLAYGWKVSYTEYVDMMKICDFKYEDEFICLNSWYGDSDYILGIWIKRLADNSDEYAYPIDMWDIAKNIHPNFNSIYNEMLINMGREDLAQKHPDLYLVHQVS